MTDEIITLSRMTVADVPEVHALEHACFTDPWDIAAYYRDVRNTSSIYLVARRNGALVGYGGMWVVADEAHIVTLAVARDERRRGIGRLLIEALLEEARRHAVRGITLEVRVGNIPARTLYESYGFHLVATRPHYYQDNDEAAAVMLLRL
jgi:ribosomal-protein-alanine N-acetyltransferase